MIPRRVTLKNFLSFGDDEQTFDFTDDESLWILTGPNGVGKSAVFDAITYCLFTEHRGGKTNSEELIRHGANGFLIVFEFEFAGEQYRITRSRTRSGAQPNQSVERFDPSTSQWVKVPNIDGASELKVWIRDTLGLRIETFTTSVLLRQGESDAIIEATGKDRLEVLKRIIDVERFEKLSNRIAEALRERAQTLKTAKQHRDDAPEVTPEQVEEARTQLAQAEDLRCRAQSDLQNGERAVEQAKRFAQLESEREALNRRLAEADERGRRRAEIERDHALLEELSEVVPLLRRIALSRDRIAETSEQHGANVAELERLKSEEAGIQASVQAAREASATAQASRAGHEREVKRLDEEFLRESRFVEAAEKAEQLQATLDALPADLEVRLQTARKALSAAESGVNEATAARARAEARSTSIQNEQAGFESVGAICSKCRQPVTKEHAAQEKARLAREADEARRQLADAEQALKVVVLQKDKSNGELQSLSGDVATRDRTTSELGILRRTLNDLGLQADPAKLKSDLEAKRIEAQRHALAAEEDGKRFEQLTAEARRLETGLQALVKKRDFVSARIQDQARTLAAAESERTTLLEQLAPGWREVADPEVLAKEQTRLESAGLAAQFAALQRDTSEQAEWKARRSAVESELQSLPTQSVESAERKRTDAARQLVDAEKTRDDARRELDRREQDVEKYRKLVEAVARAEAEHDRHRKLNDWLGKHGLLRELVREAERDIVRYAQETLRTLSGSDLEIALCDEPESEDEALVLVVRRAGDPLPIPVRFLSGSQKFRVAVAIAVAIGKFAAGPNAARPLESVIIDEGFGSLDKEGLQSMRDELENLKKSQTLKRLILVSHQEEFTSTFPVGYRLVPGESGTVVKPFRQDG